MSIVKVQKTSTLESNVSLRTIKFDVLIDGKLVVSLDEYDDAKEVAERIEIILSSLK